MTKKIPTTIITGFLGVGKTTLVRHVLANARGRRIALIINEFGDLGVDRELLKGCGDESCRDQDMIEMANGCICCTVADEFIPTIETLLERPDRPDHIIIETSGLALPQPLVRAFNWPQIKSEVTIDGVVTMVDAAALSEGRFASDEAAINVQRQNDEMLDHETPLGELFKDQLVCADMVVINKTDLVDGEQLVKLEKQLRAHLRAGTHLVHARNGEIDIGALLGMGLASEDDLGGRDSLHELEHDGMAHEHGDFDSFSLCLPAAISRDMLIKSIEQIMVEHDVLRLKGFGAIKGAPARLAIQAVGPRVNSWFDRSWQAGESAETRLVVIGQSPLNRKAIEAKLRVMEPA
ncbi:CobW GTPase involved in cobalt insertion for B12 biosynthesis [hydrothermal vent metagenome]|uniref:CobW GTPase involved in cobalt insertion for B12 biosynthesis n=1 Tax=hydrothermal vent metagenome TaxID=652676 RepID=A0A3B0UA38_9ZZZZ